MLLTIPDLLDAGQLAEVREILAAATFVDGRLSAGMEAKRVKHNEEVDTRDGEFRRLNELVMGGLRADPVFNGAALPARISAPFYARYTQGMYYGDHIDDPIMGEGHRFRCDVATTIFLNGPDEYEGGELVVRTEFGDSEIKLEAGQAVVYPASSLHRVNEVTSGERLVAVAWIQSLVRDAAKRSLLYDLHVAREALLQALPAAEVTAKVGHAYVNLVRMWSEV